MNARNVCLKLLLTTGLALSVGTAFAGPAESLMQKAQANIKQEQIADFHRRAIGQFPQRSVSVAEPAFADTPMAETVIADTNDAIRLQGRLALWAIQEEQLAGYRTGLMAQSLLDQQAGIAVASVQSRAESSFNKAMSLLKTARFEWPEFMPAALR